MSNIAILGSTGSIGTQTIEVLENQDSTDHKITYICAGGNSKIFQEQSKSLNLDHNHAIANTKENPDLLLDVVQSDDVDIVVNAIVGFSGLKATIAALEAGKIVALANKESLVAGGDLLVSLEKEYGGKIIPVDSEHSAIYQCLWARNETGELDNSVKELVITASGGPFRGYTYAQLEKVELNDALKHPTWQMGQKITIDSSTLMNKGLEVIEAKVLFSSFGIDYNNIVVTVHPQSLIHGMVSYSDGSTIAQISNPTMHLPIALAINHFEDENQQPRSSRFDVPFGKIDWSKNLTMTFEPPNLELFRCLDIAYKAGRKGGLSTCVINAANEVAVQAFIDKKIKWLEIADVIEDCFEKIYGSYESFQEIYSVDLETRKQAYAFIQKMN